MGRNPTRSPRGTTAPDPAQPAASRPVKILAQDFCVPEQVRYLSGSQLSLLTQAVRAWTEEAVSRAAGVSRRRVWLIFLLLRFTGARLGEVLALDDAQDIDLREGLVTFRGKGSQGGAPRQVLIPDELQDELARQLATAELRALAGKVLKMDAGYIRHKFYERAAEVGLPQRLVNPRALRSSRAIELLRAGMPLTVVQDILGHKNADLTSQYLKFTSESVRRISQQHIRKEAAMKTSARNSFTGQVSAIRQDGLLAEVEVTTPSGNKVVSVITDESFKKLGIAQGKTLTATIKAPLVIVVKEPQAGRTSMRNRFFGKIARINTGQIAAEIVVALADGTEVCALITDESVKKLDLKVGDEVWTMCKAFSVVLNVE